MQFRRVVKYWNMWFDVTRQLFTCVCVLYRLQRLLRLSSLDDILDTCQVEAPNIIHNMTQVNKNGIVTNIDQPGMYTLLTLINISTIYFTKQIPLIVITNTVVSSLLGKGILKLVPFISTLRRSQPCHASNIYNRIVSLANSQHTCFHVMMMCP